MKSDKPKRKRYVVNLRVDNHLEKVVIIAKSREQMRELVDKIYSNGTGTTKVLSFMESELL